MLLRLLYRSIVPGSTPPMLTGKLLGAKDVSLTINGQPTNVKALTLSDPKFKAPF